MANMWCLRKKDFINSVFLGLIPIICDIRRLISFSVVKEIELKDF